MIMLRRLSLMTALLLAAEPAGAEEPLRFEGQVEAVHRAEIATKVDGVVTAVLFEGGERVAAGDALMRIDADGFALEVKEAEAVRAEAEAARKLAEQEAERSRGLAARGIATDRRLETAEAELIRATADVARADAALARARLDLERATIRAPIAGVISRPAIALGAFVEAEAGPALATLVQLDPVFVAYKVPYDVRLETLKRSGAATIEALLERITLTLLLPDGTAYAEPGKPEIASAAVDAETGAITIWARFANPDAILRPGMRVEILSTLN